MLAQTLAPVPFQGCKSDGQVGPVPAPTDPDRVVQVDAAFAQRLTYYKGNYGTGVLAPRGWNCFETYGSSGSSLIVTPADPNTLPDTFVQLSVWNGDTSGRWTVAEIEARVFPAYRIGARNTLRLLSPKTYPFTPYPSDRLTYRSNTIVEYETRARAEGLGTFVGSKPTGDPIRGAAVLVGKEPDFDLVLLQMRLPSNMRELEKPILQDIER
jgi:hypothetical protein